MDVPPHVWSLDWCPLCDWPLGRCPILCVVPALMSQPMCGPWINVPSSAGSLDGCPVPCMVPRAHVPIHACPTPHIAPGTHGPYDEGSLGCLAPCGGAWGPVTYSCLVGGVVKSRLHGDVVVGVGAGEGQLQGRLPLEPAGRGQLGRPGGWGDPVGEQGPPGHSLGEVEINAPDEQGHHQHGQEDGDGDIGALQCRPGGHGLGHGCPGK